MSGNRTIMHIDMDAFYASVEAAADPILKGKPFGVKLGSPRSPIVSVSYDARPYGVKAGMSTYEAIQLCPELFIIEGNLSKYEEDSKGIFELIIKELSTDAIEQYSPDEWWADVTNTGSYERAWEMARELQERIRNDFELTASMGISYNRLYSKMASDLRKPNGLMVIRNQEDVKKYIWPLPVKELHNVGKADEKRFKDFGIKNIGQIAEKPLNFLTCHFNKARGIEYYHSSRGLVCQNFINSNRLVPYYVPKRPKSISCSLSFDYIDELDDLGELLFGFSKFIAGKLDEYGYRCRTVTLQMRDSDYKTITRSKSVDKNRPIRSEEDIRLIALQKLLTELYSVDGNINQLRLTVSNLIDSKAVEAQLGFDF